MFVQTISPKAFIQLALLPVTRFLIFLNLILILALQNWSKWFSRCLKILYIDNKVLNLLLYWLPFNWRRKGCSINHSRGSLLFAISYYLLISESQFFNILQRNIQLPWVRVCWFCLCLWAWAMPPHLPHDGVILSVRWNYAMKRWQLPHAMVSSPSAHYRVTWCQISKFLLGF